LPAPGVIIYRPEESVIYPNSSLITSNLVDYIKENTRNGRDMTDVPLSQRPWNNPGPRNGRLIVSEEDRNKPILRAIVFDFTAVSSIDTTAVQALIDTRGEIERYTDREVSFHFCHILSPWIRRGLIAGGFGLSAHDRRRQHIPVEIAPVVGPLQPEDELNSEFTYRDLRDTKQQDIEASGKVLPHASAATSLTDFEGSLVSRATPYFHFDIATAVLAAEREAAAGGDNSPSVGRSASLDDKVGDRSNLGE